jgi:hypothetical protein
MANPLRKTFVTPLWMVVVAGVVVSTAACSKKTPEPAPASAVKSGAAFPQAAALAAATKSEKDAKDGVGGDGKLDPNDPKHGARKMMGLDVGVFVDGVQASVLRYGDLPSMPSETLEGGSVRYKLYDYVKAIGVAPESIKSIHVHGNNDRIGSVEGSELLKDKNRFQFQFLSGVSGAATARWDTDGLKNEFVVHEIRKVTIYVKKASPLIDAKKSCHVGADGACSDAVPYASGDAVKGTRIYVDGKMVGFVKRRALSDALLMDKTADGEQKYNVAKLVAGFGVDTSGIKAVELVAGDDVIAHADGDKWKTISSDFFFTLPKHNHGKVRVHVPAALQVTGVGYESTDKDALVSSVQIFKSSKPASRELSFISEDTDLSVQLASNYAATERN